MKKVWIFLLIGLLVGSGAAVFAADDKDETREAVVHAEQLSESGYHLDAIVAYDNIVRRMSGRRACLKCGATYHIEYLPPKAEGICDS